MSEVKQYAQRDLMGMDSAGNHYCRHVSAMTREQLHSKSDIAAELGWRDMQIAELKAQSDALAAENAALKGACFSLAGECAQSAGEAELTMQSVKTPATDAYLNSVRAEGVDYVAEAIGAKCSDLKVGSKDWKALKSIVFMLGDFSSKLRAGEPS